MVGNIESVLVEGRSKKRTTDMYGRTGNNRVVNFAADDSMIGNFVTVEITEATAYALRGKIAADKAA